MSHPVCGHHQLLTPNLTQVLHNLEMPSKTRRHEARAAILQTLAVRPPPHAVEAALTRLFAVVVTLLSHPRQSLSRPTRTAMSESAVHEIDFALCNRKLQWACTWSARHVCVYIGIHAGMHISIHVCMLTYVKHVIVCSHITVKVYMYAYECIVYQKARMH